LPRGTTGAFALAVVTGAVAAEEEAPLGAAVAAAGATSAVLATGPAATPMPSAVTAISPNTSQLRCGFDPTLGALALEMCENPEVVPSGPAGSGAVA
jgi:hypothetical protein